MKNLFSNAEMRMLVEVDMLMGYMILMGCALGFMKEMRAINAPKVLQSLDLQANVSIAQMMLSIISSLLPSL